MTKKELIDRLDVLDEKTEVTVKFSDPVEGCNVIRPIVEVDYKDGEIVLVTDRCC